MRLQPDMLDRLDAWIANFDSVSRPEAIRLLLQMSLIDPGSQEVNAALDAWIGRQPDPKPSRPEAVQRILAEHLRVNDDQR